MKAPWSAFLGKLGQRRRLERWWRRIAPLVLLGGLPYGLIAGCQSKLIYFPRPYAPGDTLQWQQATHGITVDYETSQGRQRAFLQGELKSPRCLWLVCGGNGTLALEWSDWLRQFAPAQDAWLLMDFPGYGDCEGTPSPARIKESLEQALPAACAALGWPRAPDPARVRFFGHSLGGAACLIAASEFGLQRGVLVAPFTSTMEMSRHLLGVPLGFLVWHRFDNEARLAEMAARGPGEVIILHGTADEVIPIVMSRRLAARWPGLIDLREIPNGLHNTVQDDAPAELAAALAEAAAAAEPAR